MCIWGIWRHHYLWRHTFTQILNHPRILKMASSESVLVLKGVTFLDGEELGRGAYGKVYAVKYCETICAAKEVHYSLIEDVREAERRQIIQSFLRECRQCSTLRHPNVIQFLGVYYPTGVGGARLPVMVMEMMTDSLTSFVNKHEKIPVHIKYSIVHDVSLGLCYLHNHDPPIVHRDLSPNNVLLTAHHLAKISDLGVAKVIKADSRRTITKAPGTVDFMPPEALARSPIYGPPIDVFSFAGIILHTFNQQWPSPSEQVEFDPKTRRRVALSEVERRQQYLDKMKGEGEVLRPLVEKCLDDDPAERLTIATVCERIQVSKDAYMKESPQDVITLHLELKKKEDELKKKEDELKKKEDELKKKKDELIKKEDDNKQLSIENEHQKATLVQQRATIEQHETTIEQMGTSSLTTPLEKLRRENDDLKICNTQLKTKNATVRHKNKQLKADNATMKVENEQLRTSNATMKIANETNNAAIKDENKQLRTNNAMVNAENEQLKTHNTTIKDENKQLRTDNAKMKVENGQLKTNNATVKDENKQLRTDNTTLKVENEQLKTNNATVKDKNKQLRTDNAKMEGENEQLRTGNTTMRDEIGRLKAEIDIIKADHGKGHRDRKSSWSTISRRKPKSKQLEKSTMPGDLFGEPVNTDDLFNGPMKIKWKEGAPLLMGCYCHTAVWLNDLVYVGGGRRGVFDPFYNINCYDPVSNSWRSPITAPYCNFAMTTLDNKLIIAGGKDNSDKETNQILTMNAGHNHLETFTKMLTARSDATAIGHQKMLIITGGRDDKRNKLSSTELFDSNKRKWYIHNCNDLPQPYCRLQPIVVDNNLFLLGGFSKGSKASLEVFIAPLDTLSIHRLNWKAYQDTPWCLSAPVSVLDTHLLLVGGHKKIEGVNISTSDVIYKLNKVSHSWEAIGRIPSAREAAAAVSLANNRIIVIGGMDDKGQCTNTVWIGSCELQPPVTSL